MQELKIKPDGPHPAGIPSVAIRIVVPMGCQAGYRVNELLQRALDAVGSQISALIQSNEPLEVVMEIRTKGTS